MATATVERLHTQIRPQPEPVRLCVAWALLGALAVLCWQAATVHFSYGGNWTALFCTGGLRPVPPELADGTYIFRGSTGYDGQCYRYIAHDPWFQKGLWKFQDSAPLRCRRILVPALAWALAGGQSRYIDAAYIAVILLAVFLGIYWLSRYAASHGRHPAWGLGFVLLPATLISIDRLTVDVALTALCAGVAWYARKGSRWRLFAVLALAPLVRETGFLLIVAYAAYAACNRRRHTALLCLTAALPALAWYATAAHFLPAVPRSGHIVPTWFFHYPLIGIFIKLIQPEPYPWGPLLVSTVQALDAIALSGLLATLALALWSLRRRPFDQEQWAALAFVALVLAVSIPGFWRNIYAYGRVFSPLALLAALPALSRRSPLLAAPILLMDLRIAAQLAPQAWNILRGIVP